MPPLPPEPGLAGTTASETDAEAANARGGRRFLYPIAVILMIDGVLGPTLHYLEAGYFRVAGGVPAGIVGALMFVMLRRGAVHGATMLLIWASIVIPFGVALAYSGLRDNELVVLPVAAMASGFLLGERQAVWLALASFAGLTLLTIMHGIGHPFVPENTISGFFLVYVLAIIFGVVFGVHSTRSFKRQYQAVLDLSASLEQRVAERTLELEAALEKLRLTQNDLVQAGTLASLGSTVAGISHELNTPIGNALTVATSLQNRVREVRRAATEGTLRKSGLDEFLRAADEMSELIDRSVSRAADLVTSFKQVAIDQTSERRREFLLHELVSDIVATLRPGFKTRTITIDVTVPPGLVCDSYPGPLGQVLTNLIQNAVVHAFDEAPEGHIGITAEVNDKQIALAVSDNGKGMSAATLVHAFDPFFTTRLGQGGSGLGLSICHRLATSVLGGELSATSTPGSGSRFVLIFPQQAPGRL